MMMNALSLLDPSLSTLHNTHPAKFWAILLFFFIFLTSFWVRPTLSQCLSSPMMGFLNSSTLSTSAPRLKSLNLLISSLFLMILFLNLFSLLPYTFSLTWHPMFAVTFAGPLCLALVLSAAMSNTTSFNANLIPTGTPEWLTWFVYPVQWLSLLTRPVSLSLRLSITMTTGHILASMLGGALINSLVTPQYTLTLVILLMGAGYMLFKVAISFLQSYLFFTLLALYTNDHPH